MRRGLPGDRKSQAAETTGRWLRLRSASSARAPTETVGFTTTKMSSAFR